MEVTIRELDARVDRARFDCGEPALNRYFREQASQDARRRVSNCFVAVESAGTVAGFYTLSASSIGMQDLPPEMARKLPRYPILPVALLGRLAVDLRRRGRGFGSRLLGNAMDRIASSDIAALGLIVDAKSEAATAFYRSFGFVSLASTSHRLFLPVSTIRKI